MSTPAHETPGEPRGRVGMVSLGCPKNRVDSEVMLGRLRESGYQLVEDPADADTVIVNTCGFIEDAKQESIDTILELADRKKNGLQRLLVAGCMVNRYGTELCNEIPEIDALVSLDDLREVSSLVQIGGEKSSPAVMASQQLFDHRDHRALTTPGHAYLKVAEGCNNPCTFCAIPNWRGRFRSRSIESLVAEARIFESQGVPEICLVAQDTTRYGEDLGLGRHGLRLLVESLLEQTRIPWIRFLYAYPTTLDDGLLELMGSEDRFCSYLDIPLQHSEAEILRAMKRGGTASRYLDLLEKARRLVPGIALRTTMIVGFPGETESHFAGLRRFIEEARFDHLGAFAYSPEEGTPAGEMSMTSSREVAEERRGILLEDQRPIALESRQRLVDCRVEALIEGVCDETEHLLQARHEGMAPEIDGRLLIADGMAQAGEFATVEIKEAYADDLVGHIVVGS